MNATLGSPDFCPGREDHVADASSMLTTPVDSMYILEVPEIFGIDSYYFVPHENVNDAHFD